MKGGTARCKPRTLTGCVTSCLILHFLNSKMHTFPHCYTFEIKMHPTLDGALPWKWAAFFSFSGMHKSKVLPSVLCAEDRIKYLSKYLLNTYPEPDTELSCFNP